MLKFLSLEGFLNLSSDSAKKVEEELRTLGLDESKKFDDIDDFIDCVVESVDNGDTVILAAEDEEYNYVKGQLIDTFSLRKGPSAAIQEVIISSKKGYSNVHDIDGHCLVPLDADIYITNDGLYSGFCVEFSNGARMLLIPLNSQRFDSILADIRKEIVGVSAEQSGESEETAPDSDAPAENDIDTADDAPTAEDGKREEETEKADENETPDVIADEDIDDFLVSELEELSDLTDISETAEDENTDEEEPTFDDVFVLLEEEPDELKTEGFPTEEEHEGTLTLKNGEELIVDDSADEANLEGFDEAIAAAGKTAFSLINNDKTVAFVASENSPFLLAMCEKVDGLKDTFKVCDVEVDNENGLDAQIILAKKTRLAISETGASFGAAISPVTKSEKDGEEIYYSYIIIHDGASAKAKKVSTSTQQGLESLIPRAFAVMFGLIERKTENIAALDGNITEDDDAEKKKKTILLAVSVAAAAVAIVSAVMMVTNYFRQTPDTLTTTTPTQTISQQQTVSTPDVTDSSATIANPLLSTTDPNFPYPAEPTASDVSVTPTSTPFSSTKGTFTFTVYGYGHGVGMSQTGANYYAGLGKSYLEILAMYYYGATLVLGDTTPQTVKFGNNSFTLRDYLATAVESEMGSSYNAEALKAQAVAIYTFAKYYNFDVPATLHAFNKTPTQASYDAVDIVMGQYMVYNGEVAKPYFHATSAGKTTSYTNVFGDDQIPYLAGGRPSYGDVNATDYCTTVTLSSDELNALIYSKTGTTLTGDPANWLKIMAHDGCIDQNTGYVSKIQVGDKLYSGYDFRMKVLGGAIRSHCFTFIYTPTA